MHICTYFVRKQTYRRPETGCNNTIIRKSTTKYSFSAKFAYSLITHHVRRHGMHTVLCFRSLLRNSGKNSRPKAKHQHQQENWQMQRSHAPYTFNYLHRKLSFTHCTRRRARGKKKYRERDKITTGDNTQPHILHTHTKTYLFIILENGERQVRPSAPTARSRLKHRAA